MYGGKRLGADRFRLAVLQVDLQDLWIAGFEFDVLLALLSSLADDLVFGEANAVTRMILARFLSKCRLLDGLGKGKKDGLVF